MTALEAVTQPDHLFLGRTLIPRSLEYRVDFKKERVYFIKKLAELDLSFTFKVLVISVKLKYRKKFFFMVI